MNDHYFNKERHRSELCLEGNKKHFHSEENKSFLGTGVDSKTKDIKEHHYNLVFLDKNIKFIK